MTEMARSGYTAVHDAGVDRAMLAGYQSLDAKKQLPIRVYVMLSARDPELCREWEQKGPQGAPSDMLVVRAVKAYYDGALGSRGARLLDDYSDTPGHRGISGTGYGFDREVVAAVGRAGRRAPSLPGRQPCNYPHLSLPYQWLAGSPRGRVLLGGVV